MSPTFGSTDDRLKAYIAKTGAAIVLRLGFGKDGSVWATKATTAIKVHERWDTYARERDVYARLHAHGVTQINEHRVPQIIATDDELGIIEMLIVEPPFVLDFATAQLDEPMEFPEEIMAEWAERKREEFGKNWPKVVWILRELERMGVYMLDVHPGNIKFAE